MRPIAPYPPTPGVPRRGIATLEFAMALPVLLLLMVGIVWLGTSVIRQSEVLIEAREKTWQKRFEDKAKAPLIFPSGLKALKNPLYPGDRDYISETSTKPVHVSPVFDKAPVPTASNTVLAGSWDHRAMPFTTLPDWKLMATAGIKSNPFNAVGNLGGMFDSMTQQAISGLFSLAGSESGTGSGASTDKLDSARTQGKADETQHEAKDKKFWQDRLNELGGIVGPFDKVIVSVPGGQLDQTKKEIERLEILTKGTGANPNNDKPTTDNKDTNNKNGANDDPQKQQADANQRDLDFMKSKLKRLEFDIRAADTELKAAG